jgi:hypothetical protein
LGVLIGEAINQSLEKRQSDKTLQMRGAKLQVVGVRHGELHQSRALWLNYLCIGIGCAAEYCTQEACGDRCPGFWPKIFGSLASAWSHETEGHPLLPLFPTQPQTSASHRGRYYSFSYLSDHTRFDTQNLSS